MPLLVAAATDQTGRTVMMLSVALVAVAIGLMVLTVWYWRFTSPRRRALVSTAVEVSRSTIEEGTPSSDQPAPVEASAIESTVEHHSHFESEPPPSPADVGSTMGLDSEQWAMLTQAVMDEYLDS